MENADQAREAEVFRKVSRRMIWFLFLLLVVNFLDRTNIGFAALTMNKELGLSASTFGLAITAFSTAYLLCEIPSNMMLERFGARIWIARIMVTWGLAAAACAFAMGAASLIGLRVLVGIAEAGFVPGVVLYLTYWYPQFYRARAQANFMIAQPIAVAGGSIVSGLILGLDGALGLSGWRWLFLLEGIPAVILGVIVYFYLTDRPSTSKWLTQSERDLVDAAVRRDAERREAVSGLQGSIWRMCLSRNMLLISLAYMTLLGNYGAAAYWLPQIVRGMTGQGTAYWVTGLLAAIPPLATAIALPLWSARSDKAKERYWHSIIPIVFGASGWIAAGSFSWAPLQLLGLTVAGVCTTAVWSLFFTMPSAVLPRQAHAVGIAFMNTIGMLGTALSPLMIGYLRDKTGGFSAPMIFIGCTLLVGAALMLFVPRRLLVGDGGAAPVAVAKAAAE
jgi:ACS family 4-hydroxyphenylacetate permease-like MFS transporter